MRKIPASGINLFQLIYKLLREYEASTQLKALNLSLGNPDGIPPHEILKLKSEFAGKKDFALHTYAEDTNLNQFCEGMVKAHSQINYTKVAHLKAVPIAGIKSATSLIPLACSIHTARDSFRFVSNQPAYDVIGTWGGSYLGGKRIVFPLETPIGMRLSTARLKEILAHEKCESPAFIHVIRPGNPASVGATREEWRELIEFCIARKIRLVNDGAYAALSQSKSAVTLVSVACEYPDLEFIEFFSVSKSFNDPGARLGVAVGSIDFIDDFILVKGNTDSGPNPHVMSAYGELFKNEKLTSELLSQVRGVYEKRLAYLIPKLKEAGFQSACETEAGFFTLWKTPKQAFGIAITDHEHFNRLVIEKTGIVGVHFQSAETAFTAKENFIRYAVCTDVLSPTFQSRFEAGLKLIQPKYE